MPRETKATSDQFDVEGLRQLLELMEKHDVRELKLQRGDARYVLRRGPLESPGSYGVPLPSMGFPSPPPPQSPQAPASPSTGDGGTSASAEDSLVPIKSPTVGTYYQASSPGEAPFVKVGDVVQKDTIVCIVEAMKVFNQIPAGVSGTIAKILLADGDSVEYGQPLFLVKPS